MPQWEAPVFGPPFELWRDDGTLHLALADGARLRTADMKELIRLIAAMDRGGRTPVMIDHAPGVVVDDDARRLLARACRVQGHPVAVYTIDPHCRRQLELFRELHRPRFPFRLFDRREDAWRWVRERRQLALLHKAPSVSGN
jgi:hypothetical protein